MRINERIVNIIKKQLKVKEQVKEEEDEGGDKKSRRRRFSQSQKLLLGQQVVGTFRKLVGMGYGRLLTAGGVIYRAGLRRSELNQSFDRFTCFKLKYAAVCYMFPRYLCFVF